jgi:hypothetical protein
MRLTVGKTGKTGSRVRRVRRVRRLGERATEPRLAPAVKNLVVSESPIRAARGFSDERAGAYPLTRLPVLSDGYQAPRPTTYACARGCNRLGKAEPRIPGNKGD